MVMIIIMGGQIIHRTSDKKIMDMYNINKWRMDVVKIKMLNSGQALINFLIVHF